MATFLFQEIILCSNSNDKGRFDEVKNIHIQGSTLFTSDSGNNRIHYIKDNQSYFVNIEEDEANPHSVTIDKFNNLYFVKDNSYNSSSTFSACSKAHSLTALTIIWGCGVGREVSLLFSTSS